ncbi:MAG: ribonuclease D [Rhizobiales bacterium]|nr:ribonuclease H-like domain-containing protein [Hyphomicrobiales bacterium]NRB14245.1 ribonuclease D [Hyphomicrobiales bacterium]
MSQKIHLHQGDLPDDLEFGTIVAVDSETMGLNPLRDKLCLVQLSFGDGVAHLVQLDRSRYAAPNLERLFSDPKILKIFHFARFDVAVIKQYLNVDCTPIYCTKIASKLVRTYTSYHGLKDLCRELIGVSLDKGQQSSDWGAETLSDAQQRYAASDVLYLHQLMAKLDVMLARESRTELAKSCFDFMATRAELDLLGWGDHDIFSHKGQ